ncbi:MAG: Cys-Gln thioester bond-forming surface protein [Microbacterium sp.]
MEEQREAGGLPRRTIVKGAAWSVPVVAAAVAVPMAAAASGDGVTGTSPVPSGVCSPVGDFTVSVTDNGVPAAGVAVTVTLPGGFTWPGGATGAKTFTTNSQGQVNVTGVTGPSKPGTYYVQASITTNGVTTSAQIPIMIQGTWMAEGTGPSGTRTRHVYTNPVDVGNLGAGYCVAYCIEHNATYPKNTVGYVSGAAGYLGGNNFKNGVTTGNELLAGNPTASLSAGQVQAKVEWILRHSYPNVSLSALEAVIGQTGLTESAAIEATQYAIWAYTDMGYINDNWPFESATANVEKALFAYLANGAWNDTATAPSDCLQIVSSTNTDCTTPTEGNHVQTVAMVCDCDSPETPCDGAGAIEWGTDFAKTGAATGNGSIVTASGQRVGFTAETAFGASLEPYGEHFTPGGRDANGDYPLGLMLAAHLKDGAVEAPNAARDQRFSVVTTFTFDTPVSDLEFTIWDIDSARTADGTKLVYREYVFVDGVSKENTTLGSRLQYDKDGWVVSQDWTDVVPGNPDYAATFTLAGPTKTLTVRMNRPMTTAQRPDSYGAVYLSNVTFDAGC